MRLRIRIVWLLPVAALLVAAVPGHAYAAPRTSAAPKAVAAPQLIPRGSATCKNVRSQGNWKAQICISPNWDDAVGWLLVQARVSYKINSGKLAEVYVAGGLYLRDCSPFGSCSNVGYKQSPYRFTSGKSSSIGSKWVHYNPYYAQDTVQARVNTPCIVWTNHQVACYYGVMKSPWGTLKL